MIVPMKKCTIVVAQPSIEQALGKLRALGLVHIQYIRKPQAKELALLTEEKNSLQSALLLLPHAMLQAKPLTPDEIFPTMEKVHSLHAESTRLKRRLSVIEKELSFYEAWGAVSLTSLKKLEECGVHVKLYVASPRLKKQITNAENTYILKRSKNTYYITLISLNANDTVSGAVRVLIPDTEYAVLKEEQQRYVQTIALVEAQLQELSRFRPAFTAHLQKLEKEIEFVTVQSSMAQEEGFAYLCGYCPAFSVKHVREAARKNAWGLVIEEPDTPHTVPTLLKNPRWIEIIRPVFSFMETVPGYKEYDISFWFLLFFSLFFAMLIGDAGYGFVFLGLTAIARKKIPKALPEAFFLLYVLSIATIVWGAVTGTWFGVEKVAQLPVINVLVIERLNSFVEANQQFMIFLCFTIGLIHLTTAHAIAAFRYINSVRALAQVGWICIVWAAFFIAQTLVLGKPLFRGVGMLLLVGAGLIIFFSHPQKNFFKGALMALSDLPLKLVGSFSDVVSYIRLFAVGLATVMVAGAFNDMAGGIGASSPAHAFLAAMVLFLGHTLNIILGLMSVVVHGIRLNMLEFGGHLNMEWSGKKYNPFRE